MNVEVCMGVRILKVEPGRDSQSQRAAGEVTLILRIRIASIDCALWGAF